uniref:Neuropeptide F n=1 Tax=Arthurdendyus triangulatus TaxID=132421 RepID=NPF_ARTTR|nr:RecName: Full=Neuropeptide F; Short=NPF [Arthurdendyus triangulatus]AAB22842.1 neuropeptide F, NPF=pancreatic polypeptide immunoreactive peptide [Artioposthia triangulata, Peptide, 36 aa] [Arthurdendyus triangulatus]prf//1814301A neuropeptide F [Arthurdendyus triangulatus]
KVVHLRPRSSFSSEDEYQIYLRNVSKYIQLYGRPRF